MYIDRVKRAVETILNTDNRGNFKPEAFNTILYHVLNEIIENWLVEVNRLTNRENRGLVNGNLENLPDRIREKLMRYAVTETVPVNGSTFPLPTDIRYFDGVYDEFDNEIEMCKNMREFKHIKNYIHTTPTANYPIGIKKGDVIEVLPTTIVNIVVSYLRQPYIPKWTYTIVDGVELFNPSAVDFQDIDMHVAEEENIVRRVLLHFGINLKEDDIQKALQQQEIVEEQKENNL